MTIYQNQFADDLLAHKKEIAAQQAEARMWEILKGMDTRRLMRLRDQCYATGYVYLEGNYDYPNITASHEHIIAVLNTREHIPNKREASRLRRERAKRGR